MSKYYYKTFINETTRFALIDDDGGIRAVSPSIEGITEAKKHFGWGVIYRCKYIISTQRLILGELIE